MPDFPPLPAIFWPLQKGQLCEVRIQNTYVEIKHLLVQTGRAEIPGGGQEPSCFPAQPSLLLTIRNHKG